MGDFGRPQGLDGSIRVNSYSHPLDKVFTYQPWILPDGKELSVARWRSQGKRLLAEMEGYSTRTEAHSLTGVTFYVNREQLPSLPQGEYYWHDLTGLCVRNTQGVDLGTVATILPGSGFPLVIVKRPERPDVIFPYRDEVVINVDLAQRLIQVEWDDPT